MNNRNIPKIVIDRLPWYLQTLNQMAREGLSIVSSLVLAERLDITPAQIRKDLSYFGEFGKQGSGYPVFHLMDELQTILNINHIWQVAIVGVGGLGHALLNYHGFARHGFETILAFDNHPNVIGKQVAHLVVQDITHLEDQLRKKAIKIGILTVPARQAQIMAERLVSGGVLAILNYAPITLHLPPEIQVQSMDPVQSLQRMTYFLPR